jgi:hypothetical protein
MLFFFAGLGSDLFMYISGSCLKEIHCQCQKEKWICCHVVLHELIHGLGFTNSWNDGLFSKQALTLDISFPIHLLHSSNPYLINF